MSQWRSEALTRLPELQRIIADRSVDGPMRLWIELYGEFERLCRQTPPPLDLLQRIWGYGQWCLDHPSDSVVTAVVCAYFEHMLMSPAVKALLPQITSHEKFLAIKPTLLYHNDEQDVERFINAAWRRRS